MITVKITDDMIEKARLYEEKADKQFTKGNNYTGYEQEHRWYNGHLGELAFLQILKDHYIKAYYFVQDDRNKHLKEKATGRKVLEDFWIYIADMKRTVDVKTATEDYQIRCIEPLDQYKKYTYDYYIGTKLTDGVCQVWGYMSKDRFKGPDALTKESKEKNRKDTMWEFLKSLTPIEYLLKGLTKGPLIQIDCNGKQTTINP